MLLQEQAWQTDTRTQKVRSEWYENGTGQERKRFFEAGFPLAGDTFSGQLLADDEGRRKPQSEWIEIPDATPANYYRGVMKLLLVYLSWKSIYRLVRAKLTNLDFDMKRLALDMLNIKVWIDGQNLEITGTIPVEDSEVVTTSS